MNRHSHLIPVILATSVLAFGSGCSDTPKPLAQGEIIQCEIAGRMEHPTPNSSRSIGAGSFTNGTVTIFQTFVLISDTEGRTTLAPLERVATLHFRKKP